MLVAGVVDSSASVFVDLLTYSDLEQLKRKRNGGGDGSTSLSNDSSKSKDVSPVSQKRYLILTHADEFDKTHYPLPLLFEDELSPKTLQQMVNRLKKENEELRNGTEGVHNESDTTESSEIAFLRRENDELKEQLELAATKVDPFEIENAPPAYQQLSQLQSENKALSRDLFDTRCELGEVLKVKKGLSTELSNAESSKKRMLAKKQRELEDALSDIATRREIERELRIKVKDLGAQCDGLERRLRASGGGYVSNVSNRASSRPTSRSGSVERNYQRPWSEAPARVSSRPPVRDRNSVRDVSYHRESMSTGFRTPQRGRSPSPSVSAATRGRSPTPRSPRFDPTAYVTEKRAREEQRFRSSARGMASGAASPARERDRVYSRGASPSPSGRSPSPGRSAGGFGSGASRGPWTAAGRAASPRVSNENKAPRSMRTGTASTNTTRSASPGRVLRDVQRRLTDVVSDGKGLKKTHANKNAPKNGKEDGGKTTGKQAGNPSGKQSENPSDASAEIADIDSRLAALQMFLKEAKQVGSPAAKA